MQYMLTPYSEELNHYAWIDNVFNEQELNTLQKIAISADEKAEVGGYSNQGQVNNNIRRSSVKWLSNNNDNYWIYERMADVVSKLNSRYFRLDLTGFGEPFQATNYSSSNDGNYDWHQDFGAQISRKLSVVLQLTDPSEYEGGNLQLLTNNNNPVTIQKRRGLIVAFPSWVLHKVEPVTKGNRQSLVSWVSGPMFR